MNRMIHRVRRTLLGAAVATLMQCAVPGVGRLIAQEVDQSARVAKGAAVYGNMCGRCHNPRSPLERDDRDWVTIINHMRIRANLTGGQVRTVLAFLQATNSDPSRPTPLGGTPGPVARRVEPSDAPISGDPALVSQGELLVAQRACLGCHLVRGAGGNVGPSLDGVATRRDPRFLRQKLIDPTFNNSTSMMPNFGLTADEVEAIIAFLGTLSEEDNQGPGSRGR